MKNDSMKNCIKDCKNLLKLIMDDVMEKQKNDTAPEVQEKLDNLRENLISSLAGLIAESQNTDDKKKSIKRKLIRLRNRVLTGHWFHLKRFVSNVQNP